MEKYYKASDVGAVIEQLLRTPYYQHEGESWYSGVSAVWDELISLGAVELEQPKECSRRLNLGLRSYCSNCGELTTIHRYCASCGAKVKE
jgi:hypothetical protein